MERPRSSRDHSWDSEDGGRIGLGLGLESLQEERDDRTPRSGNGDVTEKERASKDAKGITLAEK
jgi:hypothetical protein